MVLFRQIKTILPVMKCCHFADFIQIQLKGWFLADICCILSCITSQSTLLKVSSINSASSLVFTSLPLVPFMLSKVLYFSGFSTEFSSLSFFLSVYAFLFPFSLVCNSLYQHCLAISSKFCGFLFICITI